MNESVPNSRSQEIKGNRVLQIDSGAEGDSSNLIPSELETLAKVAEVSVATLQEAGSFYADNIWKNKESTVVQVCGGTSCRLGGGRAIEEMLHRYGHECQRVYCLGYCDRPPVSMIPEDQLFDHSPASIRNFAPEPIITRRILEGSVCEIGNASESGVYAGLVRALGYSPAHLLEEVEKSGERGRGGAGIPTGKKWRSAAESVADQKFVIADGDEGDPGSFLDRVLMERDPHTIIEGMILCGFAIGASEGIVYIRSEYPRAVEIMHQAITEARSEGYLGKEICGSGFDFDIRVFIGKDGNLRGGEAVPLEDSREEGRLRSFPELVGLHGKPTVVNNVETLSNIPFIALKGGEAYSFYGTHATSGTKGICLNHGFRKPGLVEVELGITFREVIEEIGGGARNGEPLAAVLIGGPMGTILKPENWDFPICHEVLDRHGIQLGHGGFIAIPESIDFHDLLIHLTEFMILESCGKCVSCRLGSQAFLKAINENRSVVKLEEMLDAIEAGSLCTLGQFVPSPIRTLISDYSDRIFWEDQGLI